MRTEQTLWEKDRDIMRKQLSLAREQGFVIPEPETWTADVTVVEQMPVDAPAVVQASPPAVVTQTIVQPTAVVTQPTVQPDPTSDTINQEIVLSDGDEISLPDDVSDLGR